MLLIVDRFLKTNERFVVINVYAQGDVSRQQSLWDNISIRLVTYAEQNVCACRDFNDVCHVSERRSVGTFSRFTGMDGLNQFVDINILVDLPLWGRSYTWYKGDGKSMSRIDCFLLSDKWCLTWPNCFQLASTKGLPDHCPLVLSVDEEN